MSEDTVINAINSVTVYVKHTQYFSDTFLKILSSVYVSRKMDSAKTSLVIGCVVLAMTLFDGRMTSHAYDDGVTSDDDYVAALPMADVSKRSTSSFCRRCRFHRDDWVSCGLCYGRPRGIVPYYGKRSFGRNEAAAGEWQEEDPAGGGDDGRSNPGPRGVNSAVLYARCCDALGLQGCCRRRRAGKRGYYTVYFPDDVYLGGGGGEGERYETMKRGYETSFLPLEENIGGRCSCCDEPMFDYSCCSLSCSKRK